MAKLTEHFELAEFVESDTATRMGIDNTPTPEVIENLKRTAQLGEIIRTRLSELSNQEIYIKVLSGARCEVLEHIVCEKDYRNWCQRHGYNVNEQSWQKYFQRKAHPQGRAMDFHAPKFGNPFHVVRILTMQPEIIGQIDQIILEGVTIKNNEGWVHVAWSEIPRHQIMTAIFKDGVPTYINKLT